MSWFTRLKNALDSRTLDSELEEEMRDHLLRRAGQLEGRGASPEQARQQASRRFGNMTKLREQSRETRLCAGLEATLQDLRYAMRAMRKSPAFAAAAILSLSLAIGSNTAIYSIVDAAILRPLPVPHPERLVTLAAPGIQESGASGVPEEQVSFSYPLLLNFQTAAASAARLALFSFVRRSEIHIGGGAPLEWAQTQYASGEAFATLEVPPALGRLFSKDEDQAPGGHPVAVLSYGYWQRRFAGDRGVLQSVVEIDGRTFRVVGIASPGFFGIQPGKFVDVWIPATMYEHPEALKRFGWSWFRIIGRLAPGVTWEQLRSRLQPSFSDSQKERVGWVPTMPGAIRRQFLEAKLLVHSGESGASRFRSEFERPLWIVLGVAAGMLLIACANVASLLLARSSARAPEMAMRISLGAGRVRLIRQLLTESLLLSLLAGACGWLLARVAAPVIVQALSTDTDPVQLALALDTRVLLFCVAVSTLAAVLFGLMPAWQASRTQPMTALRGAGGQAGRLRLGRFFVAVQVAFAFCLVMTGAAFLLTLRHLYATNPGFDPRQVAVLSVRGEGKEKRKSDTLEALRRWLELQTRGNVAFAELAVFSGGGWSEQVMVPGKPPSEREEIFLRISPGYFRTMRTHLRAGRDLDPGDRGQVQPVSAIVNRAFERRYLDGNALGREFSRPEGKAWIRQRVVGVVEDAFYWDLRHGAQPIVYVPMDSMDAGDSLTVYIRSGFSLGDLKRLIEGDARAVAPGLQVHEMTTLEALVENTLMREKLLAGLGGVFALLGLLLAAIGLFGLLNYSVVRRTKEIGIRAALGAQTWGLVWLVVRDLIAMVSGGLAVGLVLSLLLLRGFESLLFGVRTADPEVLALAGALFLLTAMAAGGLPARRAAGVDPLVALRHE